MHERMCRLSIHPHAHKSLLMTLLVSVGENFKQPIARLNTQVYTRMSKYVLSMLEDKQSMCVRGGNLWNTNPSMMETKTNARISQVYMHRHAYTQASPPVWINFATASSIFDDSLT